MSRYTALLDANVLYPAPMRDLFMQLAVTDLFNAKRQGGEDDFTEKYPAIFLMCA